MTIKTKIELLCDKVLPSQVINALDSGKIAEAHQCGTPRRQHVLGASPRGRQRVQLVVVGFSAIIDINGAVPMTMATRVYPYSRGFLFPSVAAVLLSSLLAMVTNCDDKSEASGQSLRDQALVSCLFRQACYLLNQAACPWPKKHVGPTPTTPFLLPCPIQ